MGWNEVFFFITVLSVCALTIDVEPNTESWEVAASDADTVNTNGKMTAYNGSYDLAKKLQNAMSVATGSEVTLPAGGRSPKIPVTSQWMSPSSRR